MREEDTKANVSARADGIDRKGEKMTKNEAQQKLIAMLRKDAFEATTLVAHCVDENKASRQEISRLRKGEFLKELDGRIADELKKLQDHNAALAVSLQEFFYRVSVVVPFDDAEWVRDLGEEILKQLKEGPK